MKKALLILVRMYQVVFGPLLGGACRYYPSCSHYAVEAIERHGAGRGCALAVRRVLRCHPFAVGGIDLVPAAEPDPTRVQTHSPSGPAGTSALPSAPLKSHAPASEEEFAR